MDPPHPNHEAAAESSGTVGFAQVGSVDWVSFSKSSVTMSVEVLARLEGAGVQALTYHGALHMAGAFTISEQGRVRVLEALDRLGVESAFRNVLYFGFGHRSLLRHLSDSVGGLKCIALCGCLAEMHSETISARVLASLWRLSGYPEQLEPSLTQFKSLIRACAGALSKSVFSEMGQRMIGNPQAGICSDPKDIAAVLLALFELSQGTREQVVVTGNQECAFISAISYWIFGFSILVEDQDGHLLFMSFPDQEERQPQVRVIYSPQGNSSSALQITGSIFALRDPTDLIKTLPEGQGLLTLRYRLTWSHCLETAFGQDFKDLASERDLLGRSLAAAARIYLGIAQGETDVAYFSRRAFINFNEHSYGMGFVESARVLFPELHTESIRLAMHGMMAQPVSDCCSTLMVSISEIRRICQCLSCQSGERPRVPTQIRPYCLMVLTITLIDLIRSASSVVRTSTELLGPTLWGLHAFYQRSQRQWSNRHNGEKSVHALLLGLSEDPFRPKYLQDDLLHWLVELFTGSLIKPQSVSGVNAPGLTAVSIDGVCVYREILASPTWKAAHLGCFRVVPGFISRDNSIYNSIRDPSSASVGNLQEVGITDQINHDHHRSLTQPLKTMEKIQVVALVDESEISGELVFWYRISPPDGGESTLRPGFFTQAMLEGTGAVSCPRFDCSTEPLHPCRFTEKGWPSRQLQGHEQSGFYDALRFTCARDQSRPAVDSAPHAFDSKESIPQEMSGWFLNQDVANDGDLGLSDPIFLIWSHLHDDNSKMLALAQLANISTQHGSQSIFVIQRDECLSCCTKISKDDTMGRKIIHIVYG